MPMGCGSIGGGGGGGGTGDGAACCCLARRRGSADMVVGEVSGGRSEGAVRNVSIIATRLSAALQILHER
jgi:hypothetical protein